VYGVATISRLLKITYLFCKRAPQKRLNSAKETYNLKEPTNRSHPICFDIYVYVYLYVSVYNFFGFFPQRHSMFSRICVRVPVCERVQDLLLFFHSTIVCFHIYTCVYLSVCRSVCMCAWRACPPEKAMLGDCTVFDFLPMLSDLFVHTCACVCV